MKKISTSLLPPKKLNRRLHRWGSILIALPLMLVTFTGILLVFKKQLHWIQPPTAQGSGDVPTIGFNRILEAAMTVPEAKIHSWSDVCRMDVRPGNGMVKVQSRNRWEVQIDTQTGEVLQAAYRRSDLIEALHDGTFFSDLFKHGVVLPSAMVLIILIGTGMYLFVLPLVKRRKRSFPKPS